MGSMLHLPSDPAMGRTMPHPQSRMTDEAKLSGKYGLDMTECSRPRDAREARQPGGDKKGRNGGTAIWEKSQPMAGGEKRSRSGEKLGGRKANREHCKDSRAFGSCVLSQLDLRGHTDVLTF